MRLEARLNEQVSALRAIESQLQHQREEQGHARVEQRERELQAISDAIAAVSSQIMRVAQGGKSESASSPDRKRPAPTGPQLDRIPSTSLDESMPSMDGTKSFNSRLETGHKFVGLKDQIGTAKEERSNCRINRCRRR